MLIAENMVVQPIAGSYLFFSQVIVSLGLGACWYLSQRQSSHKDAVKLTYAQSKVCRQ